MKIRVGINGFGRIGRYVTKLISQSDDIEVVAINDLAPIETLAHLYKYDSIHGQHPLSFSISKNKLKYKTGKNIMFYRKKNPEDIPWKEHNIDIVIESTGLFKTKKLASKHIQSGAKKVIISAPPSCEEVPMFVVGINDNLIKENEKVISNASCTTNSVAPLIEVVKSITSISSAYITTVHSYTTDQKLHDSPHSDLRRARAGAENIVPTTTGAAKAICKIYPELKNSIGGCGIRVPVSNGSLTDLTLIVKNKVTIDEINDAFKKASKKNLKNILEYVDEPIVSKDIIGNSHSTIFDSQLTSVIENMIKVVGWYDNEAGYSNRIIDLIKCISRTKAFSNSN